MRIALFTNNYFPRVSGVAVAVNFLDEALRAAGHETFIIAPDYGENGATRAPRVHRVPSIAIPSKGVAVALKDFELQRILGIIEGFQPDIIHAHHPFLLGETAVRAADTFGIPLIYTFHTLYEFFTHYVNLDIEPVRQLVRDFTVSFTDRCDLVIAPTEPIRSYAKEIGVSVPTATLPTGIDFTRFDRVTPERIQAMRDDFGLDRFDTVLLSVGRITREKNVNLCLDCLGALVDDGVNAALLMFGRGPDEKELTRVARKRGLQERFILGGFLDQDALAVAYHLGDVFLFPSFSDTQGIVLYEALAAGLPIVATDSMASRAAVRPGENGAFAEADGAHFARAVRSVCGSAARRQVDFDREPFTGEAIARRYAEICRPLIERGRPARTKGNSLADKMEALMRRLFE